MQVNLGVYYFFSKNYLQCNYMIQRLPLCSAPMEDLLSQEWFFKKDLIEVVVQSELEKVDIAHQRLKSIRKNYKDLLSELSLTHPSQYCRLLHLQAV
jgi:hypothetical protein